jgi:DNA-directed RNA polymerase subunit M/transcription elongation factor TFIIS
MNITRTTNINEIRLLIETKFNEPNSNEIAKQLEQSLYAYINNKIAFIDDPPIKSWDDPKYKKFYMLTGFRLYEILDNMTKDIYENINKKQILNSNIDEIFPNRIKSIKEIIDLKEKQTIIQKVSDLYKCPYCKSEKCKYIEKGTGGSDEVKSILCVCCDCGKSFSGN